MGNMEPDAAAREWEAMQGGRRVTAGSIVTHCRLDRAPQQLLAQIGMRLQFAMLAEDYKDGLARVGKESVANFAA